MVADHQNPETIEALQARLQVERRRLRDAELVGHSGSWEWDVTTGIITWSDGLFALHGIGPTTIDGGYEQAASRVHPDDREAVDNAMEKARRGEIAQFRYRVRRAGDGETRWLDSRATGVFDNGNLLRLVGAVADVTGRVIAEAEVLEANSFLRAVLTASPDYTFVTDVRTGAAVFGSRDQLLMGQASHHSESPGEGTLDFLVHPDDQENLRALNAQSQGLSDGEVRSIRYRLRRLDGEWHWFSRHVVPFRRDETGRVFEVLGVLRDIDELVRAEVQLAHDSLHDSLTGLPNRALLVDRLQAALIRSARESRTLAVLYCDLDGFKEVNDSAGHGAGDAVLVEAAARFRRALREGDTVARVGGDEFVLVIEPWNRGNEFVPPTRNKNEKEWSLGREVAQRVMKEIAEPFFVADLEFRISASVGVVHLSPTSFTGVDSVLLAIEEADQAMYVAKSQGKNRAFVSSLDVHEALDDRSRGPGEVAGGGE